LPGRGGGADADLEAGEDGVAEALSAGVQAWAEVYRILPVEPAAGVVSVGQIAARVAVRREDKHCARW
jgi:hypothetical protein